jgi:hypothetical protein
VPFRASFRNTDAALALMLIVVAVAANGSRPAGIAAAVSAAVWFDFFLTRPYEQFTITRATDSETTVLILVLGVALTELAVWGRRQTLAANRRARHLEGMKRRRPSSGSRSLCNSADRPGIRSAHPYAVAALMPLPIRRRRAGQARPAAPRRPSDRRRPCAGLRARRPAPSTELLVENHGVFHGRFLMAADPQSRPTLEQRLVAVAFADQADAALAVSQPIGQ